MGSLTTSSTQSISSLPRLSNCKWTIGIKQLLLLAETGSVAHCPAWLASDSWAAPTLTSSGDGIFSTKPFGEILYLNLSWENFVSVDWLGIGSSWKWQLKNQSKTKQDFSLFQATSEWIISVGHMVWNISIQSSSKLACCTDNNGKELWLWPTDESWKQFLDIMSSSRLGSKLCEHSQGALTFNL